MRWLLIDALLVPAALIAIPLTVTDSRHLDTLYL